MSSTAATELAGFLERVRGEVDGRLDQILPGEREEPTSLHRSMRYSVFAGGKRLRPALVWGGALCCSGGNWEDLPASVADAAAAVELVHTYSLIHDDLPCMDDDDLRRGKPTNHKVFGEAVAVLAGDALLTLAFEILAAGPGDRGGESRRLEALRILARASGSRGMAGGQAADIEGEGSAPDPKALEFIHRNKTAALIAGAVEMGGALVGGKLSEIRALGRYGECLGLAFQAVDDILGEVGETGTTGKPVGSDAQKEKMTAVRVLGVDGARARARALLGRAERELAAFGPRAGILRALAEYVIHRKS